MSYNLRSLLLPSVIFFTPLIFWTITPNFFLTPKQIYILIVLFALLIAEAWYLIKEKKLKVSSSPILPSLLVFSFVLILNIVVNKEGRTEALISRLPIYIGSALLAYFASYESTKVKKLSINALIASSTVLALHSLLQLTILHDSSSIPSILQGKSFTLSGNPLLTLSLLIVSFPTALYLAGKALSQIESFLYSLASVVMIIASVAYVSLILPGQVLAPTLLSYGASWSIALDAMKNFRTILFGVGISNFSSLYTAVKPLSLNATSYWSSTAQSATSEMLQLLATTGLTGLLSFIFLGSYALKGNKNTEVYSKAMDISLFLLFAAFIFLPATLPITAIFFIFLGLKHQNPEPKYLNIGDNTTRLVVALIMLGVSVTTIYYFTRLTLAERYMRQAQIALQANDGKVVYEKHLKAVQLFPNLTNYRVSYSSVNLTLAAAISSNKDITESDRENITQLVSQAVREAKIATSLRPHDASTWTNLGYIYRNLINVATDADQFAIQSYAQGVALDPGNPVLRVDFGGLLYQLGTSEKDPEKIKTYLTRASQEFRTAIQLKPDYANAYYQLGKTLEASGNIEATIASLESALAKIAPDSEDRVTVQKEIDALKAKLPKTNPGADEKSKDEKASTSNEISAPSPLPSPLPGGEINLETESN